MTTHVLERLQRYVAHYGRRSLVDVELLRAFVPELKLFCLEEQNFADLLLLKVKTLQKNNLLKNISLSDDIPKDIEKIFFTIDSQLNLLDLLLKASTVQDRHYTAIANSEGATGFLRTAKAPLIEIERTYSLLKRMLITANNKFLEEKKQYSEDFDRADKQALDTVVANAYERSSKKNRISLEEETRKEGASIDASLKNILVIYEVYARVFVKARDTIASIEKELTTQVPRAEPLLQGSLELGELLVSSANR